MNFFFPKKIERKEKGDGGNSFKSLQSIKKKLACTTILCIKSLVLALRWFGTSQSNIQTVRYPLELDQIGLGMSNFLLFTPLSKLCMFNYSFLFFLFTSFKALTFFSRRSFELFLQLMLIQISLYPQNRKRG